LNRDGFAEGVGTSNVGGVNNGLIKWSTGDNVEANISWSGGNYVYIINNVMAHNAIAMQQIAIRLYESRTFLSPFSQQTVTGEPVQLTAHVSPLTSSGEVRLYHSRDNTSWVQVDSNTPENGSVVFLVSLSDFGIHYFKASWIGDDKIDGSSSSTVRILAKSPEPTPSPSPSPSPTPTPTPTPTPQPTASPSPSPTPSTTASPSPEPTKSPTPTPTSTPSPIPTSTPTPLPSPSQTPSSTYAPSPQPTQSATPLPEERPLFLYTMSVALAFALIGGVALALKNRRKWSKVKSPT
jgi:hypothetical protein